MSASPVLPIVLTSALQFVALVMLRVHHFGCLPRQAIVATLMGTNNVASIPLQFGIIAAGEVTGWLLEREVRDMYARGVLERHSPAESVGGSAGGSGGVRASYPPGSGGGSQKARASLLAPVKRR